MRQLATITRREFVGYFATPLAVIFIIVFLLANSLTIFYLGDYFAIGQADLVSFFMFHPWLYLFFLPAIAMRLWAEERRHGSIELLLTLPVPLWVLVLGKYLAALAFSALALALTFPLWLTVNYLGAPDNGVIAASYLGSFILAAAYLAIGACISALTGNQVIAFVVAVVVCFMFTISGASLVINLFEGWGAQSLINTLASFSMITHFRAITGGVIDARDLVFFISLIAAFLVANIIVLDLKKTDKADTTAPRIGRFNAYYVALILLPMIFLAVNMAATNGLRTARLDLTERALFTLSAGSKNILRGLDEPIRLKFYYSQKLATDQPAIRLYAQNVRDMLEEMAAHANGALQLQIIDPEAFSQAEDQAIAQGLVARPVAEGEVLYFGLVGTNLVDNVEVIPYFAEERQEYLEYDLARLIYNLAMPQKPALGVISNLPLDTGAGGVLAAMRGQSQPFLIYAELTDRFDVQFIDPQAVTIPQKIDVLLLAHPRNLTDWQIYAVDQFVMRGGRILAFIDPQSEVSLTAGADGAPLKGYREQSNLPKLMRQWGVKMDSELIIADRARAQRVATGRDARRALSDYILWMALGEDEINQADLVTANIDRLNVGTVGALAPLADASTIFTPLITSSDDAMLMHRDYVLRAPTPEALLRRFEPSGERYTIAARLTGAVQSAFAAPPEIGNSRNEKAAAAQHIGQTDAAHIIIFADSDFFDDRFWVSAQNYLGQIFGVPIADNGKFLLNAVENMMGSSDLISLRGRERVVRGFTRFEALRRAAETQYLAEEEKLLLRIDTAQAELDALQQGGAQQATAQQAAQAGRNLRHELLAARKALRRVQGNLRRDIDNLAARLTWLNILFMPLVVAALAMWRSRALRHRRIATQQGKTKASA